MSIGCNTMARYKLFDNCNKKSQRLRAGSDPKLGKETQGVAENAGVLDAAAAARGVSAFIAAF